MHDIVLFGEVRCHKTRYYQAALDERGLTYEMAEVDKDPMHAERLTALVGSPTKFPTFAIKGKKLRNPRLPELDKVLARAGLYDPGLIHNERSKRFIRYMSPSDAFVSYTWRDETMVLTHIEVDPSKRTGYGARLAIEVLEHLEQSAHPVRLECAFLQRVAETKPQWRDKYLNQ